MLNKVNQAIFDKAVENGLSILEKEKMYIKDRELWSSENPNDKIANKIHTFLFHALLLSLSPEEGDNIFYRIETAFPEHWVVHPLFTLEEKEIKTEWTITEARYKNGKTFSFQNFPTVVGYLFALVIESLPTSERRLEMDLGWAQTYLLMKEIERRYNEKHEISPVQENRVLH